MSLIDLTHARQRVSEPSLIDYGITQTPFLGGVASRIDRPGSRHMMKVTLPPMPIEAEGRKWIARLVRAKQAGGTVRFPQVNFDVGAPGNAVTVSTATAGGRTLPITGANPHYAVREGQALTVYDADGRGYLYLADEQTILDASGAGDLVLDVPLRAAAAVGDVVNLIAPTIEGWIEGDGFGWTLDESRVVGLSFTVRERA